MGFKRDIIISVLGVFLLILTVAQCQYGHKNQRNDGTNIHFNQNNPSSAKKPEYINPTQEEKSYNKVVSEATINFSLNMMKELLQSSPKTNVVVSPLSVASVLALLHHGATDSTSQQLESVLGLSKESGISFGQLAGNLKKKNIDVSFSNGVFVDKKSDLNPDFKSYASNVFGADVTSINFKKPSRAAAEINNWVDEKTNKKIQNIVRPESIQPNTDCILVNAVFFKSQWENDFNRKDSTNLKFQPEPGQLIPMKFMHQNKKYIAGIDDDIGAKWVELPFVNNFTMVLVLPKEQHELDNLISRLNTENIKTMISGKDPVSVIMNIPKFNIAYETSLVEPLRRMGVTKIFDVDSGLTGILGGRPLQVGGVFQKATISIDEKGATASASTIVYVNTLSLSSYYDEIHFTADQPFMAMIVDKINQVPIFMAKIYNPSISG